MEEQQLEEPEPEMEMEPVPRRAKKKKRGKCGILHIMCTFVHVQPF